jgi:hypothetical protein
MNPNPSGDKANHTPTVHTATIDPIHQSSPESNFEGDREVYMVGQGDQPLRRLLKRSSRRLRKKLLR